MISTEYEKDGEMRRGYTIGKGFDISQMSGKPLEERPQRSLTELIGTVLKDQSVRVQIEDDLPDKVQAQYNPRYRTIYIRNGMSEVTTFHALNRELACAALDQHTGTYSRQKVSAQAYCAAYVIAKRYGVDVTGFNLEYIAQRNECGKKDPQELRDFLNDVRQASYSIRNHIERNFGAKEQEYVTDEFAIGDPVKTPETKDEKASGKEKKAKKKYPSVAYELAEKIQEKTDKEVRITVPGHTQRGGSPCAYDRVLATRLGAEAARAILEGDFGCMVGTKNQEIIRVPLSEVAGKLKYVDPKASIIKEAKTIGISFGDE